MKIYFCGSIQGGRKDQVFYFEIIEHLKKFGRVLTEHIGNPDLKETGQDGLTAENIYGRDVSWLEEADIVIAEVSNPSLGVGYELGIAEKLGKNILCLYRTSSPKKLSAMIAGNNKLEVWRYDNLDRLFQKLDKFFEE